VRPPLAAEPEVRSDTVAASPHVRRLFIVDLCGASLSALLSGLLLPGYSEPLGVAPETFRLLSAVAVVLALIDAAYLVLQPRRWRAVLHVVALGNLTYPLLALALSATDEVALAPLGVALFVVESLIVVALGGAQLLAARRSRT